MRLVGVSELADDLEDRPYKSSPDGGVKPPLQSTEGTHQEPRLKPGLLNPRTQAEAWVTNPRAQVQNPYLGHRLHELAVRGGLFCGGFFGGGFVADTADYGLNQVIDAFFFWGVHYPKAKLGFVFGALAGADGKGAAKIVLNEGGFVARFLAIPGEHAKSGEIAGLAFGATSARDEVLRMLAVVISDAIQFKPGDGTNIGGAGAVANGIRKIQRNEASDNPSGDRNGLIPGLRGGVRGRIANGAFTGRASRQWRAPETNPLFCFPAARWKILFRR